MKSLTLCLVILFLASTVFSANTVTLQWDASPTPDVGYIIYYAPTPTALTADPMIMCSATVTENCAYARNVGPVLTTQIADLAPGDWYFAATAYNEIDESVRSNVVNTSFAGFVPTETLHIPITKPATVNITITVE